MMDEEKPTGEKLGELAGQVALVTGGGRGIGRAIAETLAAAGAGVAVLARSGDQITETVKQIEAAGGRAQGFAVDVTDLEMVQRAVQETEATLGVVDLLVSNAAVTGNAGPSWEVDPDDWWRCQEINVRGPFLCARAVLPGMVARGHGRIINVASLAGIRPMRYSSGYAVSKAALIRWSENLALETAAHGVRVFAIHPGDVMTAMAEQFMSDEMAQWLPWTRKHFTEKSVPISLATDLVYWLASGKGDALSGCFLSVYEDVEQLAAEAEAIQKEERQRLRLRTASTA